MLNERSLKALTGVHPDLVKVVHRADELTDIPFIITEGIRSKERQRELFAKGLSKTLNSRHITGHAVDFAPILYGEVTWKTPAFLPIIKAFKQAAAELGIAVEFGADWKTFKDYPHAQLSRRTHP